MALMTTKFYSETLQLVTTINVIVPDTISSGNPPATLYLLHGLSDDAGSWLLHTPLMRYTAGRPFIIIMPDVHRSFYTDMAFGNRYWTYLTDELPKKMIEWFPVTDRRDYQFVAGLSMGGYGALKWGLNFPEKFAGIASMSGAVDIASMLERMPEHQHEFYTIFGDPDGWNHSVNDLFGLVDQVSISSGPKPDILQFCGTADFLYQDNLKFKAKLDASSIPHTYHEKPQAGHEWTYWDEDIQIVLEWIEHKLKK